MGFLAERLPFDWTHPIGFSIAILFQYVSTALTFVVIGSATAIGIGSFVFALAIIKDIEGILHSIDEDAKSTERGRGQSALEQLGVYIQIHSKLKEFSKRKIPRPVNLRDIFTYFSSFHFVSRLMEIVLSIYRPICLAVFIFGLIWIVGTALMLQVEMVLRFTPFFSIFPNCYFL